MVRKIEENEKLSVESSFRMYKAYSYGISGWSESEGTHICFVCMRTLVQLLNVYIFSSMCTMLFAQGEADKTSIEYYERIDSVEMVPIFLISSLIIVVKARLMWRMKRKFC